MTDTINTEEQTQDTNGNTPLTVKMLIESLSTFPQDSEVAAGIQGIGLTIPLVGAIVVDSAEGVTLSILQLHREGVINAIQHGMAQPSDASPVEGTIAN